MRHQKATLKLNRTSSHRKAMFRNMVTSLFKHERIRTTDPKAKELTRWADKLITLAKRGDLHARRQALSIIRETDVVHKLFENASERYGNTNGGYTRVTKIGRRPGDAALMSMVELVIPSEERSKKSTKKKAKSPVVKDTTDDRIDDTPAEQMDEQVAVTEPEANISDAGETTESGSKPDPVEKTETAKEPDVETSEDQANEEKPDN